MTPATRFSYAHHAKCPKCSTPQLSKLRKVDGVDKMQSGIVNLLHRLVGGQLYHCWFCRLQFYDARPILDMGQESVTDGGGETQTQKAS